MHMANELLSAPVAGGTIALAGAALGWVCHKARRFVTSESLAMMGVLGAFVFAAQMVNYQLPFMPGTSGHLVGAVLLAIVLGPYLGAVVISSVVIVQCLIFQDGGLLALGCNILNMAIVPSFVGFAVYRLVLGRGESQGRMYLAAIVAAEAAMLLGAALVPIQAAVSGVITVPFTTFLWTMLGVHALVGLMEGIITAAVLIYLRQVRPDTILGCPGGRERLSRAGLLGSLVLATLIIGAGLALYASDKPDGLEWSYLERPDEPGFQPMIHNEDAMVAKVDEVHSRMAPLPDYTLRASADKEPPAAWGSFAAVVGSAATMILIWAAAWALRRREAVQHAPCPN